MNFKSVHLNKYFYVYTCTYVYRHTHQSRRILILEYENMMSPVHENKCFQKKCCCKININAKCMFYFLKLSLGLVHLLKLWSVVKYKTDCTAFVTPFQNVLLRNCVYQYRPSSSVHYICIFIKRVSWKPFHSDLH